MKNLLTKNIGLKLISLVVAAVIWLAIMNMADPVVSETFTDIPVTATNVEVITSRGYQYTVETGEKVDITCKGKRSIIYSLSKADFKAYADFNTLNSMYMAGITVECTSPNAEDIIINQRTENMAIKLEDQKSATFSVRIAQEGQVKEGYYCHGMTPNTSLIEVSGAASQVDSVKEIVAYVNVDERSESFEHEFELVAYNFDGEEIDPMKLGLDPKTVFVSVEIFRTKEVEIGVVTTGTPAPRYYVEKLVFAPSTVKLAAKDDILWNIDKIMVEFDITGLSQYTEVQLPLEDFIESQYGDEVYLVDSQAYVSVAATITPFIEKSIEIREQDIEVRNLAENLKCIMTIPAGLTIKVRGAENILSALTIMDLKPYIDLSGAGLGTWDRQIRIDYGSDVEMVTGTTIRVTLLSNEATPHEGENTE
ncbi:MAG: hypothetical protein K6E85_02275 [Lachnospiraceae bacterium]|nr:hypothetical protein [Lachnospiraceae bacterium]